MLSLSPSHPPIEAPPSLERLRKSCDACQEAKVKCSQHKPFCHRCLRHGQPCVYSPQRRTGRPRKKTSPAPRAVATAETEACGTSAPSILPETAIMATNEIDHNTDFAMLDFPSNPQDMSSLNGLLHPSFEATFESSFSRKDQIGNYSAVDNDVCHADHRNRASPVLTPPSDILGDFSLYMQDSDYSFIPPPLPVPDADQLPQPSLDSPAINRTGDCEAKCYSMLLQQLLFLRHSLPETSRPSIDMILQVERRVRGILDQLLGCSICISNRSSTLLLSTILERVVQMLDWIIEEKTLLDTENDRSSRRALRSWARNPLLPPTSSVVGRRVCHVPLMVGTTQLDEDTKQYFLKHLILIRMKRLAAKLQEVRRTTSTRPNDCIYRAAELVLVESQQRLGYLRGQVQLWK